MKQKNNFVIINKKKKGEKIMFYIGTIETINKTKAYGFIKPSWAVNRNDNLFFHFKNLVPRQCFLEEGKEVLFRIELDAKGVPMAQEVFEIKYADASTIVNAETQQRPEGLLGSQIKELRERK